MMILFDRYKNLLFKSSLFRSGLVVIFSFLVTCVLLGLFVAISELMLIHTHYQKRPLRWAWVTNVERPNMKHSSMFEAHPNFIYAHKKNVIGKTDALGLRLNTSESIKDDASRISIVTLGDSFTYGDHVSNEETYPHYLQSLMNEDGVPVVVYNAGVNSYSPDQEIVFFVEELLNKHRIIPDILIWQLYSNDLSDALLHPLFLINNNSLYRIPGWINGTYLVRKLVDVLPVRFSTTNTANLLYSMVESINPINLFYRTPEARQAYVTKKMLLLREYLEQTAEVYGIDVLVTIAPSERVLLGFPEDVATIKSLESILQQGNKHVINSNGIFSDAIEKSNLSTKVLGLQNQYNTASLEKYFIQNDVVVRRHLSAEGNYILAESMLPLLYSVLKKP